MQYLIGFIGMAIGLLIIIYRKKIHDAMGTFGWAEQYLGAGGTFTALAGIGILVFIGSLMWMFGTLQAILLGFFGPLFGVSK